MADPHELAIFALGPVQIYRGEQLLTQWAYLDTAELLFYLLQHTHKPKRSAGQAPVRPEDLIGQSREQIGLALWPDASPKQLKGKLKSRLHHLRRALGDASWIVYDNSQYKFDLTRAYAYDVERFEAQVTEGDRLAASAPDKAIACYQAAAAVYRGDFLAGLPQRRARKDPRAKDDIDLSGREWHFAQQEALQADYLSTLHKLAELLVRAQSYEPAAELYQQAAIKDDYDDGAHHGRMLCLALQGKRGQALAHYRRLLERRADTPPGAEIVALAERLKRGEELAPRPPMAAEPAPAAAALPPEASAPFQAPADLPRFVGREPELEAIQAALAVAGPERARPYCLAGMGGIGKTSLAVHLAHRLRGQFPDGVLWAHVSTSEPLDILDSWARAYHCDFSALPDLDSRASAVRALLADKTVLIILDDVWDAARARPLLVGGPAASVLLTGRDMDVAQALDARIAALPVLAAGESQQLLARLLGPARVAAEAAAAEEICQRLGHLPLALDIAAHRLAARPRWTLSEMAQRIRLQQQRLDELQLADREVRASFNISWEALDERLRQAFATLGVFGGRAFAAAALAGVRGGSQPAARDDLEGLVALSLLSFEEGQRYRQHPLLADFAREHLEQAEAAEARMAHYYLAYATGQRQNYLALEQEWDNLAAGIEVAGQQKLWQALVDFGDVLTNAWFARGRFSQARQAFGRVCQAAVALEEQDAYIAATINWGRACIEQGDYAEAQERLRHGLQTSRDVQDGHGVALAQFYLARVAHEQSQHAEAKQLLQDCQALFEQMQDWSGVGNALLQQARIAYRYYDYAEVDRLGQRALELLRPSSEYEQTIDVLRFLALSAGQQGRHDEADQYAREAVQLCESSQYQAALPGVLYTLMQLSYPRGDYSLAQQYGEQSLALFTRHGDRKSQTVVLEYLVRVYLALENYELAAVRSAEGVALAKELQDGWATVYALRGMGKVQRAIQRSEQARQAWSEALAIAQAVNHPLADELSTLLNGL